MKEYIKMLLRESLTDDELLKEIFKQLKETDGKELNLYGKGITDLPEGIGNLKNLERLNLRKNELTSLPESIGNLTNLKELNLMYNKLTDLPESIGNLKNLERLLLPFNRIRDEKIERIEELLPNTKVITYWNMKHS
tara:strand:+ start:374 stop:784 length:411 start_codon:yes stop_codon:yes gene_type:complete